MPRGLIFDLGSTLIHTDHNHAWAVTFARMQQDLIAHLQQAGFQFDPAEFARRFSARVLDFSAQRQTDWVEVTTAWILAATFADLGLPPPAPALVADALAAYYAFSETRWHIAPDAHATLQALRAGGLRLGLLSNARDEANVQRLIDKHGLRAYFDPIVVSAAAGVRKPNPVLFERIVQGWGLAPAQVVVVGDTLGADILGAQLAGLRNVWLNVRAGEPANRAHRGSIVPEAEIAALAELPGLLAGWAAVP
jgi:putative hydrolase of the HAD superfamily